MAQAPAHTSMRINGVDVADRFGFVLSGGYPSGLGLPPIRPRLSTVPGRHGVRNHGAIYDPRTIEIQGQIWADDFGDAHDKLDKFKGWIGLAQNIKKHIVGSRGIEGMKLELQTWRPGRYFLVTYNGTSDVSAMPGADEAWETVELFQFSIGFLCTPPFLIGDQVIKKITATGFHEITGLGTAPVNPIYHIFGANTSPTTIVKVRYALTCDFKSIDTSGNPNKARDIFNDADKTLALTPAFRYMPARLAQGIGIFGNTIGNKGDTVTLKSMIDGSAPTSAITDRLNRNQGTLSIWITPEWKYTTGRVRYVLADGASGELTISYNPTSNRLEASDGTNVAFKVSTHAAGSRIHLVVTWDKNANSLGITIDNSGGTGSSYAASTPGATLYLGSDSSSEQQIDAVVDDLGIWDIVLSSAQIATLYNGGNGTRSDTVASDSLLVYFSFDGTQGTSIDVSTANLGGSSGVTLKTTAIADGATEDTVTVTAGAQKIFFDGDRVAVFDETGYKVEGVIDGDPASDTSILVDDGAGADPGAMEKVGVYADLNGTDENLNAGDVLDGGTNDLIISAWVFADSTLAAVAAIANKRLGSGYSIRFTSGGVLESIIDDGADTYLLGGNTGIFDGKWHHVMAGFDKSVAASCKIYLDGFEDGTTSKTGTLGDVGNIDVTGSLRIGSDSAGTADFFKGGIKDVRIWIAADLFGGSDVDSGALTLATNPNGTTVSFNGNAESGWWLMDDAASVATLADNSSSSNTLDLIPTPSPDDYGTHSRTQLAYISPDLLADSGMENGGIGAYFKGNKGFLRKITTANKDNLAFELEIETGDAFADHQQDVVCGNTEDYVFRGWRKRNSGAGNVRNRIFGNGGFIELSLTIDQTSDSWEFQEASFQTTGTQTEINYRGFISGVATDKGAFDTLQLLSNRVVNGGMEGQTPPTAPTGWAFQTATGATGSIESSSTQKHSTPNSLKLIQTNTTGNCRARKSITSLKTNSWYEASAWVYIDSTAVPTGVSIRIVNFTAITPITNADLTKTNQWQRVSLLFQTTSDLTGDFDGFMESANANDFVYFDDVSIIHRPGIDETLNPAASGFHYLPTRDYQGLYLRSGDTLALSSIVANKDELGFTFRLEPQFDSAVSATGEDKTVAMFRYDATNFYRLYYDWSAAKWKLHVEYAGSTFTVESAIQTFSEGDFIELSGRYKGDGTVAAIQVNGTVYTTTTGTAGALASNPTAFHFGYSLDGTTFSEPPNSLIDDFAIFAKAPTADELTAIWTQQTPLENLNSAMVINLALAAGDRFTADVDGQVFSYYDASVPSETDGGTYLSTRSFPTFTAEQDNRTLLYLPNAVKEIQAVYRPAYL